jgi:uncharacterized membrane protein (DUF4010 family)
MHGSPWLNFAVAVAIGLLIGVERERRKGEGASRQPLGIRTFAIAALLGALASHVGGVAMIATVVAGVTLLAALSYLQSRHEDPGLTTEVGIVATILLGALATSDMPLAAALGVVVSAIFSLKEPIHDFVTGVLTEAELRDGLLFAIVAIVVWPQLPNRYMGPFDALNPSSLGLLVVLVLGIGAAGHVATRALGARYGLPIAGFAAGFVSSAATIASLAGYAARSPRNMAAAVAGAALSTVATFVQMAVLLFAVSEATLRAMAPALAAGGAVAALYGLAFTVRALDSGESAEIEPPRAFSWRAALAFAAMMAVMLVAAAGLKERVGETGIVLGAVFAGFVDTHAAAISVASLVGAGKLVAAHAVLPILVAMSCNAVSKALLALGGGSSGYALRIVPGVALSMAAAWTATRLAGH